MSRTPCSKTSSNFVQSETSLQDQIKSVPHNLRTLGITDVPLLQLLTEVSKRFLTRFHEASKYLETPYSIEQFETACKKRYNDLYEMVVSTRSALDDNLTLTVQRVVNGETRNYHYKYENKLQIVDRDEPDIVVYSIQIQPKCYTDLFRTAFSLINELGLIDEFYPDAIRQIENSLLYLVSLGKIYENLRGNPEFNLKCERDALNTMQEVHILDEDSNEVDMLNSVMSDIAMLVETNNRPPRYLRGIVNAIKAVENRPFSDLDYHVSFRSTGLKGKGYKGAIPALLASMVETDVSYPEDQLIGYQSHYNKDLPEGFFEAKEHTISIEQSKLKRRVIHIASSGVQDRCNYFHNRLAEVIRGIPSDCTFNQYRGVEAALEWTSQSYRENNSNNIYSADISDATGTVNQQYQEKVLSLLFGNEQASWYMNLVTHTRKFKMSNKQDIEYQQSLGQPQGFKGSFPLFALGHHIIVLAVMRANGLTNMNPQDFYRIIGDDIIISTSDPDEEILNSYITICKAINWTVHKTKGHYYYNNKPGSKPIAEFAKVTIINGKVYTPIPIKLLLHNDGSVSSQMQLASWSSRMVSPLDINDVINLLSHTKRGKTREFNESFIQFIRDVRTLELSKILQDFNNCDPSDVDDKDKTMIALAVLKSNLRSTLLDQLIPDHLRDKPLEDTQLSASIDLKFEEKYLSYVLDKEHKYFKLLQRNQNVIDALEEVFTENPMLSRAIISLELTPKDIQTVYSICDILNASPANLVGRFEILAQRISELDELSASFQMRSYIKKTKADSLILHSVYEDYLVLCKKSGLYQQANE